MCVRVGLALLFSGDLSWWSDLLCTGVTLERSAKLVGLNFCQTRDDQGRRGDRKVQYICAFLNDVDALTLVTENSTPPQVTLAGSVSVYAVPAAAVLAATL